jgi:uncharacterized surface protein with fasciclin (FAS1) repeats
VAFTVDKGFGRDLKQFGSEFASDAASPDSEDYSYDNTVVCYPALEVISLLNSTDNLTYFQEALYYTGVADLLSDPLGVATVLAPTDQAFLDAADQMGVTVDELVNSPVIIPVLLNHLIGVPILSSELSNNDMVLTALGQPLNVSTDGNTTLMFSSLAASAEVVDGDFCNCDLCSTVVDVIDAVLLPEILNVTSSGAETVIVIGSSSGRNEVFVVLDESGMDGGSPAAAPAAAPTASTSRSASQSTGISLAPTTSSSIRQSGTTSTGMTYGFSPPANS